MDLLQSVRRPCYTTQGCAKFWIVGRVPATNLQLSCSISFLCANVTRDGSSPLLGFRSRFCPVLYPTVHWQTTVVGRSPPRLPHLFIILQLVLQPIFWTPVNWGLPSVERAPVSLNPSSATVVTAVKAMKIFSIWQQAPVSNPARSVQTVHSLGSAWAGMEAERQLHSLRWTHPKVLWKIHRIWSPWQSDWRFFASYSCWDEHYLVGIR